MGEPIKFVASTEALRIPNYHDPADEQKPKRPIIGDNPLNSFENYNAQVKTDLSSWMTFSVETRIERAKIWANQGKTDDKLKIDMDRRCKILNYVIWLESHHPLGNSTVAAIAFKGLFPNHKATPMPKVEEAAP